MPPRKGKEIAQVKIRLHSSLLSQLETAAKKHKISFNAEAAIRLGKSFAEEEAFGGEAGRQFMYFIATAFLMAGQRAAGGRKISQWIKEPDAYAEAMFGVIEALMIGQPEITPEKFKYQMLSLEGRVRSHFINKLNREKTS